VTKRQFPLAPWFAPTMYGFCAGMIAVVFGSVLLGAVRAFNWDLGLRVAGSAGVLVLTLMGAWVASRIVRDARLATDTNGLTVSVGGSLRHVAWSEIKSVTRVETRGNISIDLETSVGPVTIYPQRYRDPEGLLEVLLANLSPALVWSDA